MLNMAATASDEVSKNQVHFSVKDEAVQSPNYHFFEPLKLHNIPIEHGVIFSEKG